MRAHRALAVLAVLALAAPSRPSLGWGFLAHRIIVKAAVQGVPEPLRRILAGHVEALSDLSLEPDSVLKRQDRDEPHRHFFEMDRLFAPGRPEDVSAVPHDFSAARRKYGEAALRRAGILPWWIAERSSALTRAMRGGDLDSILREAAYLSHYVGDLHQPLHLTENFDGQMTGNDGVHAAFERFMIQRADRDFRPPARRSAPARRIEDPAGWALQRASSLYPRARDVLDADRGATVALKSRGRDYFEELDSRAGSLAATLIDQASRATSELWTSCWIDAGRPDPSAWRSRDRHPGGNRLK